jgi:hypothetical protein
MAFASVDNQDAVAATPLNYCLNARHDRSNSQQINTQIMTTEPFWMAEIVLHINH